jgi:hypothetical protein
MIHTATDFYNKAITEIREKYFPIENHSITTNKKYHATTYTIELFNNGCLTYRNLIGRLAKSCDDSTENINSIIEKHIVSFGSYKYKPSKKAKGK